jgi:DnaK suppressor protein
MVLKKKKTSKAAPKKSAAKKAAPKKSVAKKSAPKKAAPKKAAAKKSVAKKSVAKKSVAKKSVAKKSVAKKSVAKKSVAKNAAKKSALKKSAAKKSALKKTKKLSPRGKKVLLIRERLVAQKNLLLQEAESAMNVLPEQTMFPDLGDQASAETDRNFMLRLKGREQRLLIKIEEAIEKIDLGSYGICDSCGEEIRTPRLEARPVTTLCIECKMEQEEEEKLQRG